MSETQKVLSGITPFKFTRDAIAWVEANALGWVVVIVGDRLSDTFSGPAALLMNPWCRGDMRIVGNLVNGEWQ